MKTLGLILSLTFFVPAFALLGGFSTVDSGMPTWWGLTVGCVIGVFFGLVFGGHRGRWLGSLYGPEQPDNRRGVTRSPGKPAG
jgi:hypothetical protein